MLNALIVDDEPSARDNLRHLLEAEAGISIIGDCATAI
ncbi:two-component system response regulator YehT, partial [Klebsiella pneumoniae]|nr:two-component system response regulator YehT [Klebsiella pneumoniae]